MASKFTIQRGQHYPQIQVGAGTAIAGSDAMELNIDSTHLTRADVLDMLAEIDAAIFRGKWPPAGSGAVTPTPTPAPTGFALNGSTNPALKAMLASKAGRIDWQGESTTIGGGASTGTTGLQNARQYRVPTLVAAKLSARGIPAIDKGTSGDGGLQPNLNLALPYYDPRVSLNNISAGGARQFAGGEYMFVTGFAGAGSYALTDPDADQFAVDFYDNNPASNGTWSFLIDGGAPASGPTSFTGAGSGGIVTVVVRAQSAGQHTITISATDGSKAPVFRGIRPFKSTSPAIDMIVNACCGATVAQQAASASNVESLDALGYDAPKLTVLWIGINDGVNGTTNAAFTAGLQTIINKAKLSGDVLLVSPYAWSTASLNDAAQAAYRDLMASVAASSGIAFLDLRARYGAYDASRFYPDGVHANAAFYAQIATDLDLCLQAMAA